MDVLEVQQGSRASTARLSQKSGGEDKKPTPDEVEDAKIERDSLASSKTIKSFHMEDQSSQQESIIEPENETPLTAIPVERQESLKEEKKEEDEKKDVQSLSVELPPEEKEVVVDASPEPNIQHTPTPIPTPTADTPRPQSPPEETRSPVQEPHVESTNASPQENFNSTEVEPSNGEITIEQDAEKTTSKSPDVGHDDSAISSSSMSPEKLSDSPLEERQQTPVIEVA